MIKFRQKDFSFLGHVTGGLALGTAAGGTLGKLIKTPLKFRGKDITGQDIAIGGAIIGAALGAISGTISEVNRLVSKRNVDNRLMGRIVDDLKKSGFKEGIDFTRDPKKANELKTKVCLVVSRNSGDLRVLINTVADPQLKSLVDSTTRNIPNMSAITKRATDKFNDITITTISDSSADVGLIAGLAERFIRSKYPVYLVEVG